MSFLLKLNATLVMTLSVFFSTLAFAGEQYTEKLYKLSKSCTEEIKDNSKDLAAPIKIILVVGENRDVRGIVPSEAKLNELVNDVPDIAIAIPPGPEAITLTPYYASPVKTLVCWWDLMGRKHCY